MTNIRKKYVAQNILLFLLEWDIFKGFSDLLGIKAQIALVQKRPNLIVKYPSLIFFQSSRIGKNNYTCTVQADSSKFASVSFDQVFHIWVGWN